MRIEDLRTIAVRGEPVEPWTAKKELFQHPAQRAGAALPGVDHRAVHFLTTNSSLPDVTLTTKIPVPDNAGKRIRALSEFRTDEKSRLPDTS